MDRIYSLTDLARRTREIVDTTLVSGEAAVVAGRGRGEVVVLPRDEYLGLLHALDEMRRPGWEAAWAKANREADAGAVKDWAQIKRARARNRKPRK